MKRFSALLGVLVLALGALAFLADAQFYTNRLRTNPWTGAPDSALGSYNPYTGQGATPPAYNPLTGRQAAPALNPLTGRAVAPSNPGNPFTGAGQTASPMSRPGQPQVWPTAEVPITGKAGPALEPLDQVVLAMMKRHGIPGAALAIARKGKLVYAKGFGWADLARALRIEPQTLFTLASLSKPITALAILLLVEQGKLDLDDSVFAILRDITPPPGGRVNPALKKVTVRHLLNHSGGWDRAKSGDPINWEPIISQALRVPPPITDRQFISYMLTQGLNFEPGTQMQYSNVGYIILGQIVEKVSGQPYETFVREQLLQRAGIRNVRLNEGHRDYQPGEARRYLAGSNLLLPPLEQPMLRAAGGWCISAVDLARLLTALDGSRGQPLLKEATFQTMLALPPPPLKVRANGTHPGLGWPVVQLTPGAFSYTHDGNLHGARTFMKRSLTGINWALLFNVSMQPDQSDDQIILRAIQEIRESVEGRTDYPEVDYFKDYP